MNGNMAFQTLLGNLTDLRKLQLNKSYLTFVMDHVTQHKLLLNGTDVKDRKCDNKHIRQTIQFRRKIMLRGKFKWGSLRT